MLWTRQMVSTALQQVYDTDDGTAISSYSVRAPSTAVRTCQYSNCVAFDLEKIDLDGFVECYDEFNTKPSIYLEVSVRTTCWRETYASSLAH